MCGKSSKTTVNNTPPAYIQSAQQDVLAKANQVAQTPYKAYEGELTAPINATQQGAINTLTDLSGKQITTPELTSDMINKYMSPYQQQVIDATQASLNNQNAQQANSLKGNAISAGAWGGDRAGVAQAQLAGQQKLADNLTLANLYNQGYSTALNTAQGQQALGLQTQIANQQLGVAGANALLNAGTLQQQQQQLKDLTDYQQWQQAQQYPFQTTQYLASILGGIQGAAGGTQTTTQPSSLFSDILGTGLGVAGLFGLKLKDGGTVPEYKDGGEVSHRAFGGISPFGGGQMSPWQMLGALGYDKIMANSRAASELDPIGVTANQMTGQGAHGGYFNTGYDNLHQSLGALGKDAWRWLGNQFADGGEVKGYAVGGMPFGSGLPYQSPFAGSADEPMSLADLGPIVPPNVTPMVPNTPAPQIKPAPSLANAGNDNADVVPAVAGAPAIKSLADLQTDTSWMGRHADNPLLNTGLAILAGSHDPNAAAIGRGGLSAIQGYHEQRKQKLDQAKEIHAENLADQAAARDAQRVDLEAKRLQEQAAQFGKELDYKTAHDAAELEFQNKELGARTDFQNRQLAQTAAEEKARIAQGWAQINKPVSIGFGQQLVDPRTGKVVYGGQSTFGTPITMDPKSRSLNAQTGLSQDAINFLQTGQRPRNAAQQKAVSDEIQNWSVKNGIDTSTLQARAKAVNNVVQQNVTRNNQAGILENELVGTIKSVAPIADAIGQGRINIANLANIWAGKQTNDPNVQTYRDQLLRLRNELAGYNAVAAGKLTDHGTPRVDDGDLREAEHVIGEGINSGGLNGLLNSVSISTVKNKAILQDSIDGANQQMWDLFGVGKNYQRSSPALNLDNPSGVNTPSRSNSKGPALGTVVNGYRFKGGNPNDKSNWEKAQ